jgi:hypothetical protein
MNDYARWFRGTFGVLPPNPLPDGLLRHGPDEERWATDPSPNLRSSALMVPAFPDEPPNYVVTGRWGHGMASQAFYWVEQQGPHRRFFRMPTGNAYGDAAQETDDILAVLRGSAEFDRRVAPLLDGSTIVFGMGNSRVDLSVRSDGPPIVMENLRGAPRLPNRALAPPHAFFDWLTEVVERTRAGHPLIDT